MSGVNTDYLQVAGAPRIDDVAVAPNGDLYLIHSDEQGQRVWRHPAGGREPEALPFFGNDTSGGARSVAIDAEDSVYFTTRDGNRVLKLEAGRSTAEELPFPGVTPNDVTVGPDGTVVVADAGGGVYALAPGAGAPVRLPFPDFYGVSEVEVDPDGDVYAVEFFYGRSEPDRLWKLYSASSSGAAVTLLTPGNTAIRDIAVVDGARVHVLTEPESADVWGNVLIEVTDEFTDRVEVPLDGLSPGSIALDTAGNAYVVNAGSDESGVFRIPADIPRIITPARGDVPGLEIDDGPGDAVANAYDGTVYGPSDISTVRVDRKGSNLVLEVLWVQGVDLSAASLSLEIDVDPETPTENGCLLPGADFDVSVDRSTSNLIRIPPGCDGPLDSIATLRTTESGQRSTIEVPMDEIGLQPGDEIAVQAMSSTVIDERSNTTIQDFAPDDQRGMRVVVP